MLPCNHLSTRSQVLHLPAQAAAAQLRTSPEALNQAALVVLGVPSWPGGNLGLLTQLQSNLHGLEEHTNETQVCVGEGEGGCSGRYGLHTCAVCG